jgi:hypothetical protein
MNIVPHTFSMEGEMIRTIVETLWRWFRLPCS